MDALKELTARRGSTGWSAVAASRPGGKARVEVNSPIKPGHAVSAHTFEVLCGYGAETTDLLPEEAAEKMVLDLRADGGDIEAAIVGGCRIVPCLYPQNAGAGSR